MAANRANDCCMEVDSNCATDSTTEPVELGFVEELASNQLFRLQSHFFPMGKVGGLPAWLSFKPLPPSDWLKCQNCSKPMCFLLQVYAPLSDRDDCFHRTLFLFICRNSACSKTNLSDNIAVLRCQLPKNNPFYYEDKAPELDDDKFIPASTIRDFSKLCEVCGLLGEKRCGQCEKVTYCCREHQAFHWKWGHKQQCNTEQSGNVKNEFVFPEYELVTETESFNDEPKEKDRSEQDCLADYRQYLQKHGAHQPSITGITEELEELETKADEQFDLFQRIIKQNPEQVLRYQRNGKTLWATETETDPATAVPVCQLCGNERKFEFQIMPHLLTVLGVDTVGQSIDWATVAIFTCKQSCSIPDLGYAKEIVVKQDFSD